ncbi:Upstream activation factor subunit spp27 [Psilocybe cubensis]|uniref:Upstream activation factor subunit spp27 n=2 Tax=Psilocybe cubensis TaxID=181762 RepID=A0ACB8HE77_PSICU|nr:Upstream activation factor subunit spp27 [Psilocybe cubensis]KAH9485479.1 Upstream activation factor subunit spp27 [Psilocybe cubensis]
MAFDLSSLEPKIHQILSAPGTDLTTISAKRVRRQLLEIDPYVTAEFLKEHKEEIDSIIGAVFEQVSGNQGTGAEAETHSDSAEPTQDEKPPTSRKRKQQNDEDDALDEDSEDTKVKRSPPQKKSKKPSKNGRELSDAELARKLSSEINGRATRTGGKARSSSSVAKKGSRAKKSAATVDSDDDSEDGARKKQRKKAAASGTSTGAKGGFGKEFALSEPLAALVQVDKLSRPQVVKQLWVYIKGNELQNPDNKREIICDGNLRAIFGVDKIDMFKMNKVLGQHLHEIE